MTFFTFPRISIRLLHLFLRSVSWFRNFQFSETLILISLPFSASPLNPRMCCCQVSATKYFKTRPSRPLRGAALRKSLLIWGNANRRSKCKIVWKSHLHSVSVMFHWRSMSLSMYKIISSRGFHNSFTGNSPPYSSFSHWAHSVRIGLRKPTCGTIQSCFI